MSRFTKLLGIAALALVVNLGAAQGQHHGGGWHGGGWHGRAWGWGRAPFWGWGPYWGPYWGPDYYYEYGPPPGDAVAYCMQRFKSYDPRSGTYLGYDGRRHPCP